LIAPSRLQNDEISAFSHRAGSDAGFAEERAAIKGVGVVARVPTFAFKRYWKWSRPMRFNLPYAAVGLALAIGAPAAHAQTVITTQPAPAVFAQPRVVTVPAAPVVQPVETVQTIQTVRSVRAAPLPPVRRQIVTTRTITRRVMPAAPAVVAGTVAAAPHPLYNVAPTYDVAPAAVAAPVADIYPAPTYGYATPPLYDAAPVPPAPVYGYSSYGYSRPVYDVAPAIAPAPVVAAPAVAAPVVATQPVIYRYVYEPDRILVIDPATNIAVQAIPR
jgi:hypothetical protein